MKNVIPFNLSNVYIVKTKRFIEDCKEALQYDDFFVNVTDKYIEFPAPETINGEKKFVICTPSLATDEFLDALSKYYGLKIKWIDALLCDKEFIILGYKKEEK